MRCGWSANESLGAPFEGADRRDTAQIWVKNFVFLALKWQIFFGGALPPQAPPLGGAKPPPDPPPTLEWGGLQG